MACNSIITSFSPVTLTGKHYDVFVSFRGEDTRNNFTDHLFAALQRKLIYPFRDDTKLSKGDSVNHALHHAIEGSLVYIVVLSEDYASSTWCLKELEHILHCAQLSGRRILPIFYDVDPSQVRKQTGSYEKAFAKHEESSKEDLEMVQKWRAALTQVANLSGWDIRHKSQSGEIDEIVKAVINILGHHNSSLLNGLVGMDSRIEELGSRLLLDSSADVRAIGICGMGGIGKTTIAYVLYARISHQFDVCCFIHDVSKTYRRDGPIGAPKQILHETLGAEHLQVDNPYSAYNLVHSRLRRAKALIILDNVDKAEQLEYLSSTGEWLGAGSRVIITSRDEHILNGYGVDDVYKVPLLNWTDSLQLLSLAAFKLNHIKSSYEKLAYEVLGYAKGLPLAIKVLGSFLFGRDVSVWRSALARLRERPENDIMNVLRLSFDGLKESEKDVFLDIACFFNGDEEEYVKHILDCCGFHADIELSVLIDKSLITKRLSRKTIMPEIRVIEMHDLLQELGRQIVQEDSSRKWSRLWLPKHFADVALKNMEKSVEAIVIKHSDMKLMAAALSKMSRLRLLILYDVGFSGSLDSLSNELRYIEWYGYPFMYLPSSFEASKLVQLNLKQSNIKQLWKDKKCLPRTLSGIHLCHSKNLIHMPHFDEVPKLEILCLAGCTKLVHIDPSIGVLTKLSVLNLKNCKNLRNIPSNIFDLNSLMSLNLSGCSKVLNNILHLESEVDSQTVSSILKRIALLPFQCLHHASPTTQKDLLPSLPMFYSLRKLDISFCNLSVIPDAIGSLCWLEDLDLGGNNFVSLPSLVELSRLIRLNLEHCKQLESLPELPSPPFIDESYYLGLVARGGLYIFNCTKLSEIRERCSSTAFSWMIKLIQASQEYPFYFSTHIVIPGSEIPRSFKNQCDGDSITMDLSPIGHGRDDNFIGLATCVVISAVPHDPTQTTARRRLRIAVGFSVLTCYYGSDIPIILDENLITNKSDHIYLEYMPRTYFLDYMKRIGPPDSISVRIGDGRHRCSKCCHHDGWHVEVKKCGYRWIFKQDLQWLHRGNSSARIE